jgi:hypothetical protein
MTWTCRSAGSVAWRGYSTRLPGCDADSIDRRQNSAKRVIKGLRWTGRSSFLGIGLGALGLLGYRGSGRVPLLSQPPDHFRAERRHPAQLRRGACSLPIAARAGDCGQDHAKTGANKNAYKKPKATGSCDGVLCSDLRSHGGFSSPRWPAYSGSATRRPRSIPTPNSQPGAE